MSWLKNRDPELKSGLDLSSQNPVEWRNIGVSNPDTWTSMGK